MKTYQEKLTETLDRIKDRGGGMEGIFSSCKAEGQEAMSREILLLITLRHLKGRERTQTLLLSPSLIIPFMYRSIKRLIGFQ